MELRLSYILEILEIQQQYQFWWTGPGTEVKLFQIQMFELILHWYIVIYKLQVLGLWWKYSKIQMLEFIHGLCPHFSGTSGVSTMLDNFHKQDGTLIYHTNIYIHTKGSHPLEILKILWTKIGYLLNFATWVLFWVLFQRKDWENESDGYFSWWTGPSGTPSL